MTTTTTHTRTGIHRCALCKIDRKGRFILADLKAQEIFGLTEVELFGRPFVDFVDLADHATFETMTGDRNPYDVVYDAANLTLVDSHGGRISATLVVSLNFGGNPGNYQIVINLGGLAAPTYTNLPDPAWTDLLANLTAGEECVDANQLAVNLHRLTQVESVAVFDTGDNDATLLAAAGPGADSAGDVPTDWDTESLTDTQVRATFALADHRPGLAIFRLDGSMPEEQRQSACHLAQMAATTLHALWPPLVAATDVLQPQPGALSVTELLGRLNIGALLIDAGGDIIERNHAFDQFLVPPSDLSSVVELTDLIGRRCSLEAAAAISNYLETSTECKTSPPLRLNLRAGSTGPIVMSLVRQFPGSDDLSGCFLFSEPTAAQGIARQQLQPSGDLASAGVELLSSSISAAQTVGRKLEHEHHGELTRDGGFYLKCLSHHLDNMAGLLTELDHALSLVGDTEALSTVDLDLVFEKLTGELESDDSPVTVSFKHPDLPKIISHRRKLMALLREVLKASTGIAGSREVKLEATAAVQKGECVIWIKDHGPGLPGKLVNRAFDLTSSLSRSRPVGGVKPAPNLALAREIARSLGGDVELESRKGKGTTLRIVVPLA